MKEVIEPNGVKRKVPFQFWRAAVLADPMGETAQLAVRNKDPDIAGLKIDEIPLNLFCESGIVEFEPGKPRTLSPPLVPTAFIGNLRTNEAKRMGMRPAEAGKTAR